MYVKQLLGSTIAFGVRGDTNEIRLFKNLCHNYSISRKIHNDDPYLAYVLTQPKKLLDSLSFFLQSKFFVSKMCGADGLRFLAIQEAKKIIKKAENINIYRNN